MFFAVYALNQPDGKQIPSGHRIPDELIKAAGKERVQALLDKGVITEADPKKVLAEVEASQKPPSGGDGSPTPVWDFKPEALKGKDIDILNTMARDHAKKRKVDEPEAFEDVEEAIAFMSSDLE